MTAVSAWVKQAIRKVEADYNRSADTHLIKVEMPALRGIEFYLKDESVHPTGSLKHRLARSLFLHALCNGWITEGTTVVEASSGNTAVSEAYFARLIGLPFIAVMPRATSPEKIRMIEFYGGRCHLVEKSSQVYEESARIARESGGHYLDQFTYAERATDWRGNNNIAESIFDQMREEPHPKPNWIVCSAGTGGTSATIGRYIRFCCLDTRLCVADPEHSVFYDYFRTGDKTLTLERGSGVEGIGRPRVEPSFVRQVVDRMEKVPDAAAYGAVWFLETVLGRKCGGSTGTNLFASFKLMAEMHRHGMQGSVVALICDSGNRYLHTYYKDSWLQENGYDISPWREGLKQFYETGKWPFVD
ncbi:MAG: PLP-dependent cysteine synthase family protein [Acidobacteriota bacterium]|nr:PLP-dependent cysteine synthase family protein [Acidobacteriota bacterium]